MTNSNTHAKTRLLGTGLALLLSTLAAPAQAGSPQNPTGAAALGRFPSDPVCAEGALDTRCAERDALVAWVRREAEIARLSAGWSAPAKEKLAILRAAQRRFAGAVALHEVDRRGVDRDDQSQAAAEGQAEAFVSLLRRTTDDSGRSIAIDLPPAEAQASLDATYQLVMAEPLADGSVTRAGVSETQRAWLAYRAAFVALMQAMERPAGPVEAELAATRTRDLQGLIAD